jgi:hypothetical protein
VDFLRPAFSPGNLWSASTSLPKPRMADSRSGALSLEKPQPGASKLRFAVRTVGPRMTAPAANPESHRSNGVCLTASSANWLRWASTNLFKEYPHHGQYWIPRTVDTFNVYGRAVSFEITLSSSCAIPRDCSTKCVPNSPLSTSMPMPLRPAFSMVLSSWEQQSHGCVECLMCGFV